MMVPMATKSHTQEDHAPGANAVRHGPGKWLGQPPPELTKRKGQTNAADTERRRGIERRQKQTHGLAHTHGQRKSAACRQQHQPDGESPPSEGLHLIHHQFQSPFPGEIKV